MRNFKKICDTCDYVVCYDNSTPERAPVFSVKDGVVVLKNASLHEKIMKNFGNEKGS